MHLGRGDSNIFLILHSRFICRIGCPLGYRFSYSFENLTFKAQRHTYTIFWIKSQWIINPSPNNPSPTPHRYNHINTCILDHVLKVYHSWKLWSHLNQFYILQGVWYNVMIINWFLNICRTDQHTNKEALF